MRIGYSENRTPYLEVLDEGRVEAIRQAAFQILEKTGARLMHAEARKILAAAGARVKGEIVKVPRHIVQAALVSAPKGFTVYNREGRPWMQVEPGRVYYGTSSGAPNTLDAETDELHPTTIRDIELGARVADALPNIDWVMPFGSVDAPGLTGDIHEFDAVVRNTLKPVVCCGYSGRGTELVIEMASAVAGGLDELRERPFLLTYPEPISPLVFPEMPVDRILTCAKYFIPQIPSGTTARGTQAPMTVAGAIALSVAESLFSITLAQLKSPGAPVLMAGNFGTPDMSRGTPTISPPERHLTTAAQAQVARSFGLPSWGLAGATESKLLDAQAGAEAALGLLGQTLGGVTIIHDVGYMDTCMICAADMLVLGDEIIGQVRRMMRGVPVNDYELAVDIIDQVGPGGNFVRLKHTADNCRRDYWKPTGVFYREPYGNWAAAGSKDTKQRVREKTLKIIAEHKTAALTAGQEAGLQEVKERALKELAQMRPY